MNAATEALVKALAIEIAPHRINAVSPGFVEAEGDHVQRLAYARNVGANFPLERELRRRNRRGLSVFV